MTNIVKDEDYLTLKEIKNMFVGFPIIDFYYKGSYCDTATIEKVDKWLLDTRVVQINFLKGGVIEVELNEPPVFQ